MNYGHLDIRTSVYKTLRVCGREFLKLVVMLSRCPDGFSDFNLI